MELGGYIPIWTIYGYFIRFIIGSGNTLSRKNITIKTWFGREGKSTKLYTAQYNYRGNSRYDITVKSGHKAFAPTWDMVMGYKQGTMSQDQYTKMYLDLVGKNHEKYMGTWNSMLMHDELTFVCFCKKGDFCHRVILAEWLDKQYPWVHYKGER